MRKAVWTLGLMLLVFSSCNQAPIPEQIAPEETTLSAPATASSVVSSSLSVVLKGASSVPYFALRVFGPNGYNVSVTVSTVLTGLTPGTYTINANHYTTGGIHLCKSYTGDPPSQTRVLGVGQTATATVTYTVERCDAP